MHDCTNCGGHGSLWFVAALVVAMLMFALSDYLPRRREGK